MTFTFLGTSAGKPTRERNLSAISLQMDQDNKWYLFDCGEGTQHQIMKSQLSIGKLSSIFITHLHGDHCYGLPGLLASRKMDDVKKPLKLFGPAGIKKILDVIIEVTQLNLGYELDIIEFCTNDTFVFDKFSVEVIPLVHSMESFAFYIKENNISNKIDEEKLKSIGVKPGPVYGELKKGKTVTYHNMVLNGNDFMLEPIIGRKAIVAGDNSEPEIIGEVLKDLDLLIHESTYTQNVYENLNKKVLHTTAKKLGEVSEKYKIKNLIATHISPRYVAGTELNIETLYSEIMQHYHGIFFIANDFDTYYLDRNYKTYKKNY